MCRPRDWSQGIPEAKRCAPRGDPGKLGAAPCLGRGLNNCRIFFFPTYSKDVGALVCFLWGLTCSWFNWEWSTKATGDVYSYVKSIKLIHTAAFFCLSSLSTENLLSGLSTGSFGICVVSAEQPNTHFAKNGLWWAKGALLLPTTALEQRQGGRKELLKCWTLSEEWKDFNTALRVVSLVMVLKKYRVLPEINKRH